MTLHDFIAGFLLKTAFFIFFTGIAFRLLTFIGATLKESRASNGSFSWRYVSAVFFRALFPAHRLLISQPRHTISRYVLHISLVLMPLFIDAHNVLFRLNYGFWIGRIPDSLADLLTFSVIVSVLMLMLRRVGYRKIRRETSARDMLLLVVAVGPFATGFMAYHQVLSYHFWMTAHILGGEIMLVVAPFLFVRPRINEEICEACATCANQCPSGAMAFSDDQAYRIIRYSHYLCIYCGTCQAICPDQAVTLRHEISFKRFFQIAARALTMVEMTKCETCGAPFIPLPQLTKLEDMMAQNEISLPFLKTCELCKRRSGGRIFEKADLHTHKKAQSAG